MKEEKYDFTILFNKIEEAMETNERNIEFDVEVNKEIDEHIKYLRDFYDLNNQEEYEILTRS